MRVHLGVDDDFRPARKAHPALVVADLRELVERLGLDVTWADDIPGIVRCHVADPFGNRIELIDARTAPMRRIRYQEIAEELRRGVGDARPGRCCRARRSCRRGSAPAGSRCAGRWSWCATRA